MSPDPVYLSNTKTQTQSGLSEEAILVRNTLIKHGLETPMIETGLDPEQKYARIKQLMSDVVSTLGRLSLQSAASCASSASPSH